MFLCPVLRDLTTITASTAGLPVPAGLGAAPVLVEQVEAIAAAVALLERQLAVRMAALERSDSRSDPRGRAVTAGLGSGHAGQLRSLGRFTDTHAVLGSLWVSGAIGIDHVKAVQAGSAKLPEPLKRELVDLVAPHLPGLDVRAARQLIAVAADQLMPSDPDHQEQTEQASRRLVWTDTPGGGMALQGYLPAAQADQLRSAIRARAEQLRSQGDGLTIGQRNADALSALIAEANTNRPHRGGGLPAALTLTVSLTEAERIALRDPNSFGTHFQTRPHGDARINGSPAGDAAIRLGLCCAAITPILSTTTSASSTTSTGSGGPPRDPVPGSLLGTLARTAVEPLAVGRAVRLATPAQRKALQLRDGGCVIPGCGVKAGYTEPHHVTGWAIGGKTDLQNLVSLCFVHHLQTETGRWTFTPRKPGQAMPDGAHAHAHWWITPPRR